MGEKHHGSDCHNKPIYCDPQYIVHDTFVPRFVPVIHPIVHVNRQNIVNVPQHIFQNSERTEVIDPGYPDKCPKCPPPPCWRW